MSLKQHSSAITILLKLPQSSSVQELFTVSLKKLLSPKHNFGSLTQDTYHKKYVI